MNIEGNLLTVPEAAGFLRLRESTMRAWILKRRVQFAKVGGKVLLRRADLEGLLDKSLVPAGSAVVRRLVVKRPKPVVTADTEIAGKKGKGQKKVAKPVAVAAA